MPLSPTHFRITNPPRAAASLGSLSLFLTYIHTRARAYAHPIKHTYTSEVERESQGEKGDAV